MFMMFFFMFSVDSHRASLKIENPPVGLVVGRAQLLSDLNTIVTITLFTMRYHRHSHYRHHPRHQAQVMT